MVVSPATNREILGLGVSSCVDGACLAVKCCVGHARWLADQGVPLIFVPQVISIYRKEYTCPSLLGLPDLVRQYLPPSVQLLSPVLDGRRGAARLAWGHLFCGLQFGPLGRVRRAWHQACAAQREWEKSHRQVREPVERELTVLLIGPRYLTDDPFLNGYLPQRLSDLGVQVLTAADLPDAVTYPASGVLDKRPFWTSARRSIGALEHFLPQVQGIISVAPFACGAESMLGTLIERRIRGTNLAYLELNVDEHTSEVGLITRLEAFCDLLERKKSG